MFEFVKVETTTHITTVSILANQVWNAHYLSIIGQEQIDYMLSTFQSEEAITEQLAGDFKYYIVKKHHQPVGYFSIALDNKANSLKISKLYVDPECQRQGVGSEVITFIEASYLGAQCQELWLTVNRQNTHAISFYQKQGFKKTTCIVQDTGNGFVMDDYKMVKRIKAN